MATDHPELAAATASQVEAANPKGSRLASANAGSGKTKVLVDRVTRLLLGGTPPDKILCLTYTKAAANEMQNRLFKTLGEWSVMPQDDLIDKLNKLFNTTKHRDEEFVRNARRLFAKALETPEGLKVQTIHAFCERILGRFPIEAGIQPGFEPLDDQEAKALKKRIEVEIYREAYGFPDGVLAHAVRTLASERADQTVEKLMHWAAGHVDEIKAWQVTGIEPLRTALGLGNDTSLDGLKSSAWLETDLVTFANAAEALMTSGKNDQKLGAKMLAALAFDDPIRAFEHYMSSLIIKDSNTGKMIVRKAPVTKNGPDIAREFWGVKDAISKESQRVLEVYQKVVKTKTFNMTQAIFDMSGRYVEHYETEKKRLRALDFNDQIAFVRNLLAESEQAAWILYKLDYGVQHILVDEAQDTAPSQWSIIDAIRDGFDVTDPNDLLQEVKTFFAVGDEKQSIYSFQGARPEQFMERIRDAKKQDALPIRMEMSFRSAPQILRMVDAVFRDNDGKARMFNAGIVSTIKDDIRHLAHRQDNGLVELWPLAPRPEGGDENEAWNTTPVDGLSKSSAREQLASALAAQIKIWLDEDEPIYDRELKKTRPMRADDILILVRSRNDFFDGVIRNLKEKDIPVAGADRLVISESLVVQDMLALTRFVLLPGDDLSLAEVLKGPLFNFSDDALFQIAHGRDKISLWASLRAAMDDRSRETAERLGHIIGYSREFAPFEFYRRVLDMVDDKGQSLLKSVYKRLSLEAQDALEAFLNKALAHQRQNAPSLQHFLEAMMEDKQDIKREMDTAQGEVRVMTVHGAKGLEAPVVILPDTTQTPSSRNSEQLLPCDEGLVYLPNKGGVPAELQAAWDAEEARKMQEFMRLLYVAMTRAESRLLVCGYSFRKTNGREKGCWYEEITEAFEKLEYQSRSHPVSDWDDVKVFGQAPESTTDGDLKKAEANVELPAWAFNYVGPEIAKTRKVTPSHLLASGQYADVPVRSPLQEKGVDRFRRGNLTHKLLEILPEASPENRRAAARDYLGQHLDVSESLRTSIEDEVMTVLEHPEYAHFFGPGSRAEVDLAGQGAGLPEHLRLNGQIDRLSVTDDTVYIIDYKSNRPPPVHVNDVPEIYWGQMAAYREMIRLTHPKHAIVCALLWTDGPDLMILPDDGLDRALTQINTLPT